MYSTEPALDDLVLGHTQGVDNLFIKLHAGTQLGQPYPSMPQFTSFWPKPTDSARSQE